MQLLLWISGSIGGLIGMGFLYQWIGGQHDRRRFAAPGRWVTIGRRYKLYLLEKGSTGPAAPPCCSRPASPPPI